MLKILTVPEETEILRRKSEPVIKIDEELLAFLKELGATLKNQKDPAGVGLSAIQVGKPIRAFATWLPNENTEFKGPTPMSHRGRTLSKPELIFYVNPEITEHAAETTLGEELIQRKKEAMPAGRQEGRRKKERDQRPFLEGCLSIPRIYGAVLRYPWIKAKATVITEKYLSIPSSFYLLPSSFTLEALASRVFQHELDHLNGVLFTDHVLAQGNKLYLEEGREMAEMEM